MSGNADFESRKRALDALLQGKLAPETLVGFMASNIASETHGWFVMARPRIDG